MARLGVLALDSQATTLTRVLARSGVVQVEPPSPVLQLETAAAHPLIVRYEALEQGLQELAHYLEMKLAPERSPFEVDIEPEREIGELEQRVNKIIGDAQHIQAALAALAGKRQKLLQQIENLLLLSPVNWKLEELRGTKHLSVYIGVLRDVNIRRVEATLGELPHVIIRLPGPATGWDLVLVFSRIASKAQVERTLAGANFKPLELPEELTGLPAEVEERLWGQLRELEVERKELTERLRERTLVEAGEVYALWEKVRAARLVLTAQQSFGKTARLVYVTGWVPKEGVPTLTSAIQNTIGSSAYVEVRDPLPGDPAIPVELKNPSVFKPFEDIVTTYSLPSPHEIDPTVVVAVSYLLMFGVMFGDVGQGLVLAASGFWAAKKWPSLKNLGRILGMCGISSMIFGAIYGSVFGVEGELIPGVFFPLVEHHTTVVDDNLTVLGGLTVGFGIVMLSLGIIFNIVNSIRARAWGIALFDPYGVLGLTFYWGALVWVVLKLIGVGGAFTSVLGIALLVGLVALFVREPIIRAIERKHELIEGGVGFFVVQAVIDLMDTLIRYLSNTVSFIRVAAFGLTHAALFMAIHIIGVMISGAPHGLGYISAFVIGNIFVIVMEGLIVSIQCLRLEYYEVFGKFFRGGGSRFAPLRSA